MATDKWLGYDGVELVNISRTAQLAEVLGIDTVWISSESVEWIEAALGGDDYNDITEAPWYDPLYPASAEFAGLIPLGVDGLDNSTREATTTEYITAGGRSGSSRNATKTLVASMVIVASTDRGAEYGKRWLDTTLRRKHHQAACSGVELSFFRYTQVGADVPPVAHFRDVRVTRGSSVTRKAPAECSTMWWVTFTLSADDPFEYGEPISAVTEIGGFDAFGPLIDASGSTALVEEGCPSFDYTPIYDPLYPALVPPPVAPDFYPDGWAIAPGMTFDRYWARLDPISPSLLDLVPVISLTTETAARMVRVSIWPSAAEVYDQCGALFSAVVSYVPPTGDLDGQFVIDGEQTASYFWDGYSEAVRRTDSLVYSPTANPVDWTSFNDPGGLLLTLDIFSGSGSDELDGDGTVRASLSLVPRSE